MKKTKISPDESLSIKLVTQLFPNEDSQHDLYFSIPNEMRIHSDTFNKTDFFNSHIKIQCAYYSEQLHLPLVRSRYISKKKGEKSDYRVNLNLFSYQIRIALDADIKAALKLKSAHEFYPMACELVGQIKKLLKKLRRYEPSEQTLKHYFQNADNYLSWHSEQGFLKLLAKGPKSSEFSRERSLILDFCKEEKIHRELHNYNSEVTLDDPNRITNKMRLLQRLIEHGVVFDKKIYDLTLNLRRLVRGLVTGIIMALVMYLVLNARTSFQEITVALIALLGVIYGLRETFKDELTQWTVRKIQHGRPRWRIFFINSADDEEVSRQTINFELIRSRELPEDVDALLQKRRQQNKQPATLLHFSSKNEVRQQEFMPGYEEIQQQITFDLSSFARYLKKGAGKLYSHDGNKVSGQGVERRYQINLVLKYTTDQNKENNQLERYKITMNRSEIIAIERID